MKRIELEANENNLKAAFLNNSIGRNKDVYNFISILDSIEGNFFAALDGDWGTGKTFLIKQVEMLLNYYNKNNPYNDSDLKLYIEKDRDLSKIKLQYDYVAVYYNAWLYDDHKDALLSLLYSIIKEHNLEYKTETKSKLEKNFYKILNIANLIPGLNFDFNNLSIDSADNIIDKIETIESMKKILKDVFDEILSEHGDKLVVFIDELDRCNPNYAVSVLERIKHFMDDDRIIFIYATNKNQLVHTIKCLYGSDFDASGYLNKFIDFTMKLRDVNTKRYCESLNVISNDAYLYNKIAYAIIDYYGFSMRNCNRYLQQMRNLGTILNSRRNYDMAPTYIAGVFYPIAAAIRIVSVEKSKLFESGKLCDEIINIVENNSTIEKHVGYIINQLLNGRTTDKSIQYNVQQLYNETFGCCKQYIFTSQGDNDLLKYMLAMHELMYEDK